mgnify:CR=1 FL=1
MGELSKLNREAFYNDTDLKHNSTKGKLRIMFAINQYNEGVHAPGVNGVIMGRGTHSDIVFYEQLGRAMNVAGKNPFYVVQDEIIDIFTSMGFSVASGPEIESDLFNFVMSIFCPTN